MKPFQLRDSATGEKFGPYWIKVKVPGEKGYRRIVGGDTYDAALKRQWKIEEEIANGTWVDPRVERKQKAKRRSAPQTWGELVERFMAQREVSPATEKNDWESAARIATVLPDETRLVDLSRYILGEARNALGRQKPMQGSRTLYKKSTLNLTKTFWRTVLHWADKNEVPGLRPGLAKTIETFRSEGTRSIQGQCLQIGPDDFFTEKEVSILVAEARQNESPQDACCIHFLFSTGERIGEGAGVQWRDVRFEERLIDVRRQGTGRPPKSGLIRVVPLDLELLKHLKEWRLRTPYKRPDDPIFPRANGAHHGRNFSIAPALRRVAERADITRPRYYNHMLRHSFASNWLRAGKSDWILAKILGHRDTSLIHHVYAHVLASDLVEEMDRPVRPMERPIFLGRGDE